MAMRLFKPRNVKFDWRDHINFCYCAPVGSLLAGDHLRSVLLTFLAYVFGVNVEVDGHSFDPRKPLLADSSKSAAEPLRLVWMSLNRLHGQSLARLFPVLGDRRRNFTTRFEGDRGIAIDMEINA